MEDTEIDNGVRYSMLEVKETLITSMERFLNNQDEDTFVAVTSFLTSLVGLYTPYVMLTPDNISQVAAMVFESEVIRDFILSLKFTFFGSLLQGRGRPIIDLIIEDLAIAVSCDMGYASEAIGDLDTMPKHLAERYSMHEEAARVLKANTWIICLLLIQLNIDLDDFIQKETKKSNRIRTT